MAKAKQKKIYLDHAATTPVAPEVLEAMSPYFTSVPYNAAAIHSGGREASDAVERARAEVADLIGANRKIMEEVLVRVRANNIDSRSIPNSGPLSTPAAKPSNAGILYHDE